MFDIGFWELLVIGIMALVILGPERLPGAIRSVVSTVRSVKQMANGFKEEVVSQLDAHELHANLKKAEELGMQNIGKDLRESVDELKAAAESVRQPYKAGQENQDFVPQKVIDSSAHPEANAEDEIDTFDDEFSHAHGHSSEPASDSYSAEDAVEQDAPIEEQDSLQNKLKPMNSIESSTSAEYHIQPDLLDASPEVIPEPVVSTNHNASSKQQEKNNNE